MTAAPLFFRKDLGALRPANDAAEQAMSKVKHGTEVRVEMRRPRNLQHHKKFWALASIVADNQEHYASAEHLVDALKVATGHCETHAGKPETVACPHCGGTFKHQTIIYVPHSISFKSMDQAEFEAFYERCLDIVAKHVIPGIDKDDLRREVEGFLT